MKEDMEFSLKDRSNATRYVPFWYLVYNFHILLLCLSAIAFWVLAYRAPLLYPFDFGQWLLASPKTGTIIWTACGTIIATVLLFLLKSVLLLMVKQNARMGASLYMIEGWNKLAYQQPLVEFKRPWLSGFTTINWLVALTLTTAFTTLLTPTRVLVTEALVGNELDFTAPEFWKWYNMDSNMKVKKKRCERYTYTSSTGFVRFPTCPMADDPVAAIAAGISATQQSLGVQNTSVRIIDSLFKGSTGGILPVGPGGVKAFNDIKFVSWNPLVKYPQYNYSLSQQGLSARISCSETPETPIITKVLDRINVTNGAENGQMQIVEFHGKHCKTYDKWVVMGSTFVPNEAVNAVSDLFKISLTSWGSGLTDSILSLNTTGGGPGTFSYPAAVEAALKGILEYHGTQLRMYYSANDAPGRSAINGSYQVFRIGYHHTQPTALLMLLPLIVFDPTNSTALITAAAKGAAGGRLKLQSFGRIELA
ncbi:hypothetical protein PspLS_00234 [Pyricularia sp. CBS 133598]|nr:hypothetical protein PspLS_00234 [Pyricularia sp. CBS 133598]